MADAGSVRFYDGLTLIGSTDEYRGRWVVTVESWTPDPSSDGGCAEFDFEIPNPRGGFFGFYIGNDSGTPADLTLGFTFDSASPPAWVTYFGNRQSTGLPDWVGSTTNAQQWDGVFAGPFDLGWPVTVDPASDPDWYRAQPGRPGPIAQITAWTDPANSTSVGPAIVALDASRYLMFYRDSAGHPGAVVVTVSGDTLSLGTPLAIAGSINQVRPSGVLIAPDTVLVAYGAGNAAGLRVLTVSGTTVTAGSQATIGTFHFDTIHQVAVAVDVTGTHGVVWGDDLFTFSVSGSTISAGSAAGLLPSGSVARGAYPLGGGVWCAAWLTATAGEFAVLTFDGSGVPSLGTVLSDTGLGAVGTRPTPGLLQTDGRLLLHLDESDLIWLTFSGTTVSWDATTYATGLSSTLKHLLPWTLASDQIVFGFDPSVSNEEGFVLGSVAGDVISLDPFGTCNANVGSSWSGTSNIFGQGPGVLVCNGRVLQGVQGQAILVGLNDGECLPLPLGPTAPLQIRRDDGLGSSNIPDIRGPSSRQKSDSVSGYL